MEGKKCICINPKNKTVEECDFDDYILKSLCDRKKQEFNDFQTFLWEEKEGELEFTLVITDYQRPWNEPFRLKGAGKCYVTGSILRENDGRLVWYHNPILSQGDIEECIEWG